MRLQVQQLQEKLAQKASTISRLQDELQAAQAVAQQREVALHEATASHETAVQVRGVVLQRSLLISSLLSQSHHLICSRVYDGCWLPQSLKG